MREGQTCHMNRNAAEKMDHLRFIRDCMQSWVAALSRNSRGVMLFFFLFLAAGTVKGQFVDILIDLPAGTMVKSMGGNLASGTAQSKDRNQVAGMPEYEQFIGDVYAGSIRNLQWIGISVAENVQLSVAVRYKTLGKGEKPVAAAYLNNGTVNIAEAVPFDNRVVFQASDSGLLIREMPRRTKSLTAWIGVPPNQTRELMIEYN